ncbi:MAG TPA: IclR family transcriptional regulator [Ramlibacter sp.]|uniref:IclR family transcriptional regulator n=1 Tax=Ramlibacter sp. TaxID=1917967 RepID=UPI002B8FC989|nr:IclR family transcriptional regulator [Ramlibacter sp.]HVZ44931.1 IclR family transcriptional regulator [Ramlibacter sp.]
MSKSALRVLEIMEFIAEKPAGCTHTTLAQQLKIPKSSLTVLLQDLVSKGYLQRHPETAVFTVGVQVLWLANSYLRNLNLVRIGQPLVAQVFTALAQFAFMGVPQGREYVIVCTESLPSIFAHTLQVGQRGPLYCSAVGRAMLAFMPAAQVDDILSGPRPAVTSRTRTSLREAKAAVERTRATGIGYADEESIAGVLGWAAPVFGANGQPVAAIGVGIPTGEYKASLLPRIERTLKAAARAMSEQLGCREYPGLGPAARAA